MPTVRLGLLTLPLAGLLVTWAAVASSAFFDFSGTAIDPQEAATAYASLGYFLSQFVGYILGLTFLTLGVFALTVYLSEIRGERWTLVAMVLSILGIGLLLSHYGLRTYAVPALGGAYLDGAQNAVELANAIFGDPTQSVFWGSGTLPRWAGVLLAIHAPLLSGPLPDLFSVLGALLLLGGGGWVTFAVLRRPPARGAAPGSGTHEEEPPTRRSVTRLRRTGT
jgi:hypothetical protein